MTMTAERPTYLTVDEIADELRVNPETVRVWLRQGKLKGINLGRGSGYRITPDELDRFKQERTT